MKDKRSAALRRRAEVRLQAKRAQRPCPRNDEEMERLVQELVLHEIELERQNAELVKTRDEVEKSLEKFSKFFHAAPAMIGVSTLKEGIFIDVNQTSLRTLGYRREEVVGRTAHEFGLWADESERARVIATLEAQGSVQNVEVILKAKDGRSLVGLLSAEIININGDSYMLTLVEDITERKEVEVTLRHDSTHDVLTGLYNRTFFVEELERFSHGRMFPLSIVMADVNGLKKVNDTDGHEAGDHLLRLAAKVILEAFRAEDIVARIGGDEFAVLLPGTEGRVAEESVARIRRCPEIVQGQVSIAFGIACAENTDQLAEALTLSDKRMYEDKSAQKRSMRGEIGAERTEQSTAARNQTTGVKP